jgi:Kef-type K+ transport system membrane component KefB
MTTQLLALGLQRIRQPKVIAEVIGGIILGTCPLCSNSTSISADSNVIGPTAFGRIPG